MRAWIFFLTLLATGLAYGDIRPAQKNEVDLLYNLILELAEYEKKDISALPLTKENLQQYGFGENPYFLTEFAEIEGNVVGYALYFYTFSGYLGSPVLYVEDLYVKPEYRGRGLALDLLKQLAAYALERDCCRMEGHVFAWNEAAIRFYESLGGVLRRDLIQVRVEKSSLANMGCSGNLMVEKTH